MVSLDVFFSEDMVLLAKFKAKGLVSFREGGRRKKIPHIGTVDLVANLIVGIKIKVLVGSKKGDMWFLQS